MTLSLQPGIRDDRNQILADLIARVSDLDLTPTLVYRLSSTVPSVLPWLAWQFHIAGLEGWAFAADDAEQRHRIQEAIAYHRLKGTLAGLRWAARWTGGQVLRAITPPAKTFLAPTLTPQERQQFLARHPQLRLYRYRVRGVRGRGQFLGHLYPAWRCWLLVTDAILRFGDRGYLFNPQSQAETMLTTLVREITYRDRTAEEDVEIRRQGQSSWGLFPGWQRARAYLIDHGAAQRLYRLRLTTAYGDPSELRMIYAVTPGLTPIMLRFESVAQRGVRHGVHCGLHVAGATVDNQARDRIYRRLYLFDPSQPVDPRVRATHIGAERLGMPAHHAELKVSIPGRRFPRQLDRYGIGFWAGANTRRWDEFLGALRLANRLSDKTWLDAIRAHPRRARRTLTSGPLLRSGQIET